MPTETLGVTSEGIIVAKQVVGNSLPPDTDLSQLNPSRLISIPSRFLRADRDYPHLAFIDDQPWIVADTHDRNVVQDIDGDLRIIDLVAAPLPRDLIATIPLFHDWIERARLNPSIPLLPMSPDDEL